MPAALYRSREHLAAVAERGGLPSSMTLAEFAAYDWPEGERWELILGVPLMSPSPVFDHQLLASVLNVFVGQRRPDLRTVVELDLQLAGAESYVRPDLMVVAPDADRDGNTVPFQGTPLLVVEVESHASRANDHGAKRDAYAQAGIAEYWAVDPATGALTIYVEPADGKYRQAPADEEGYVHSPMLGVGIRIRRKADTYDVQTAG